MNRTQQLAAVIVAAIVAAVIVAKVQSRPMPQPGGYHDLGQRMNARIRLATKLSPDAQPGTPHPPWVAHPSELEANVILGPHRAYRHARTMSPNVCGLQRAGWSYITDPPSEQEL